MGDYLDSKQFMVSWVHLCGEEIDQQQVEGLHRMHALVQSKQPYLTLDDTHRVPNWEELMDLAFDRNGLVSVKEII